MPKGVYTRTKEMKTGKTKRAPLSKEWRENMSKAHLGLPGTCGMLGKKHSEESKEKVRQARLKNPTRIFGANNYNWKGGITPLNETIRKSVKYKKWRAKVFKRDGYVCVIGGASHGIDIEADHIKPFSTHPKLRFRISNGRTLCKLCHKKTPTYGKKLKPIDYPDEDLHPTF